MTQELDAICTDDFVDNVGFSLPTAAMHTKLAQLEAVRALRHAYTSGAITADEVRARVSQILQAFQRGRRLPKEECLAAIVVSISGVYDQFAGELVESIAEIRASELPLAPRIARFCRLLRDRTTQNTPRQETAPLQHINWVVVTEVGQPRFDVTREEDLVAA